MLGRRAWVDVGQATLSRQLAEESQEDRDAEAARSAVDGSGVKLHVVIDAGTLDEARTNSET